jgi:hypothetical protein
MTDPDWIREQRVEAYREEATALFEINQAGRSAAERVATLIFTLVGVAVAAGVAAHSEAVAIPFAPLTPLFIAYMCHQYADVSVTGAARWVLEERIGRELGVFPMFYEHAVATIRQQPPLCTSFRFFQLLTFATVLGIVVFGLIIAAERLTVWATVGCIAATLLTFVAAVWAAFDMWRSYAIAREALGHPVG